MKRRQILIALTAIFATAGVLFASAPFFQSMLPTDQARLAARVRIPISEIPSRGAYEIDYRWYRAFIVKEPNIRVFVMPYHDGAYLLPDPSWDHPRVQCKNFVTSEAGFSCEDSSLHKNWNEQATWDRMGKNLGTWMPDLQTAEYKIEENHIVLEP